MKVATRPARLRRRLTGRRKAVDDFVKAMGGGDDPANTDTDLLALWVDSGGRLFDAMPFEIETGYSKGATGVKTTRRAVADEFAESAAFYKGLDAAQRRVFFGVDKLEAGAIGESFAQRLKEAGITRFTNEDGTVDYEAAIDEFKRQWTNYERGEEVLKERGEWQEERDRAYVEEMERAEQAEYEAVFGKDEGDATLAPEAASAQDAEIAADLAAGRFSRAVKPSALGDGKQRYYEVKFEDAVEKIVKNKKPIGNEHVFISETPNVFKDIGLPSLPVMMNQNHVLSCYFGQGEGVKAGNMHGLRDRLKSLPRALSKPMMVIANDSNPSSSVIAIVKMQDRDGHTVIAPVEINGIGQSTDGRITANIVKSAFGKKNLWSEKVAAALRDEVDGKVAVFYVDSNEARTIENRLAREAFNFGGTERQLLRSAKGTVHSISDFGSPVKGVGAQIDSRQFKRWFGGSKVVDEKGEPLKVYRGSEYDPLSQEIGKGVIKPEAYFTADPEYANRSRQGGKDDGPSLKKIGTGEGSQVYGWGLYGSTVRGVAEGYAESGLRMKHEITRNGKSVKRVPNPTTAKELAESEMISSGDIKSAASSLAYTANFKKGKEKALYKDAARYAAEHAEEYKQAGGQNLYEQTFFTDRAPGDESHLLKWYEPVSKEQLKWIESRLKAEGIQDKVNMPFIRGELPNPDNPSGGAANAKAKNGRTIYDHLANKLGSPKGASEFLARAGIDGVKYPVDSYGGKGVKDGDKVGWNYVSFRDDNIRVDHKWTDGQLRFSRFAGEKGAENMGVGNANHARSMESAGADREKIWRETGWWKGKDGKWRFELPSARMKGEKELEAALLKGVNDLRDGSSETTLEKVMDAPELFEAYPQLKDTKIVFSPEHDDKTGGWYDKEKNEIVILDLGFTTFKHLTKHDQNLYNTYQKVVASDEFNQQRLRNMDALGIEHGTAAEEREQAKKWIEKLGKRIQDDNAAMVRNLAKERGQYSTFGKIVHEVQHAVQDLEGFAKGGNPESAAAFVKNLERKQRIWLYKLTVEETAKELGTTNPYEIEKAIFRMLGATSREQVAGLEAEGWIPDKTGRDKGYNLFARGYDNEGYEEAYDKYLGEMNKSGMASWWNGSPHELYSRLAGEVEARNASRREEMTPEERAATPPWATEDVPENRQIIRFSRAKVVSDANGNESYKVESNGKTKRYKTPKEALEDFIKELDGQTLNEEQQGVYDVVTGVKNTADIRKNDLGELVKFHKGGRGKGAGKIIAVHYAGKRGKVTAKEVIDIGQVIRSGTLDYDGTAEHPYSHTYTATASDGAELKVVIDLDKKGNEAVINFYSDRKTGNGGQRPHPVSTTTSSSPQSIPNSGTGAQGGLLFSRGDDAAPEAEYVRLTRVADDAGAGERTPGALAASRELSRQGEIPLTTKGTRYVSLPLSEMNALSRYLTGHALPAEMAAGRTLGAAGKASTKHRRLAIAADILGTVDKSDMAAEKAALKSHGYFANEDAGWASNHSKAEIRSERERSEEALSSRLEKIADRRARGAEPGGQAAARRVYADQLAKVVMAMPHGQPGVLGSMQTVAGALEKRVRGNDAEADAFLDWMNGGAPAEARSAQERKAEMFAAFLMMPKEMETKAKGWYDAMRSTIAGDRKLADAFRKMTVRMMTEQGYGHIQAEILKAQDAETEAAIQKLNAEANEPIKAGGARDRVALWFATAFPASGD